MDKKYTSLEHSIRNIMTETVGVTGKDKPEGTPRSFLKPVGVISPPKGEEHPGTKKTATILAQRGEDKVQHGLKKEEVLDEASLKSMANTAGNITRNVADIATYGGADYLGATRDYLAKNIGSLVGLTKPTTFAKELGQEKEKTKKAEEALPDTIKTGVKTVKAGQEGFMAGAGKHEFKAGLDYLGKKITGDDKEKWGGIDKELGKLGTEYAQELQKGQEAYKDAPKTYTSMEVGGTASALVGLPLAAARGTVGIARLGAKYGPRMVGATGKNVLPKTAKTLSDVNVVAPTAAGVSATAGHAATADEKGQSEIRTQTNKALQKTLEPVAAATKPLLIKGYEKISEYERKKREKEKLREGAEDLFIGVKGVVKSADEIMKEFKAGKTTLKDIDAQLKYMSPGPERAEIETLRKTLENQQVAKPAPKPTEPGREGTPVRRDNDNVPPRRDDKVVPIRRAEPGKWPAPYKPGKDKPDIKPDVMPPYQPYNPNKPFKPKKPANVPEPEAPPKRVAPEPAPVKIPAPAIPDKGRPAPTINPYVKPLPKLPAPGEGRPAPTINPYVEPAPKAPPKPDPEKLPDLRPAPYTNPKTSPAARPTPEPGAFPAADPAKKVADDAVTVPKTEPAKDKGKKTDEGGTGKREPKGEKPPRKKRFPFGFGIPSINPQTVAGLAGNVPAKQYMHYAQDYVEETNPDIERRSIENVARPGGKTRIAKQGEIKAKIIDENAERVATVKKVIADKKNSTVILKPKLKHPELDEN